MGGWTAAPRSGLLGKEAHLDFCSLIVRRGRPSWPALPGVAVVGGAQSVRPPAHSYLQALQRKTNDSLGVVHGVFILNRVDSPCLSREATANRRGVGDPGRLAVSVNACVWGWV